MKEDLLNLARQNSANQQQDTSNGGGSVLLRARRNVLRAADEKARAGVLTDKQIFQQRANANYQRDQFNNAPKQLTNPEGQLKTIGETLRQGPINAAARASSALIGSLATDGSMSNGGAAHWSEDLKEANRKLDTYEAKQAEIAAEYRQVEEALAAGKIDQETYDMTMNVVRSKAANNTFDPRYDEILKKPVVASSWTNPFSGNETILETHAKSGYEARKKNQLAVETKEGIVGDRAKGIDNFWATGGKYDNVIGNMYADQTSKRIQKNQEARGETGKVAAVKRWAEVVAENPTVGTQTVAESFQYLIPYIGTAALLGDIAGVEAEMIARVKADKGTNYISKEDSLRIKASVAAYAASAVASKAALQGAFKGNGFGGLVNSTVGKAASKVAGTTAGKAVAGTLGKIPGAGIAATGVKKVSAVGLDAGFEGAQEVLQTGLEEYGATGKMMTDEQFGQSFVLGAAAGASFGAVGQVGGGLIQAASDKIKGTEAYQNLKATDAESLDSDHAGYNPSRVVNERSKNINNNMSQSEVNAATKEVDDILKNTQNELDTLKRNQSLNVGTDFKTRSTELENKMQGLEAKLEAGTITPAERAEAQEVAEQIAGLKTEQEYTDAIKKVESNLKKLEAAHGEISAKLSDVRANKGYADYVPQTEESTTEQTSNPSTVSPVTVAPESVDSTSDTYAPDKALNSLKAGSVVGSTTEEQAGIREQATKIVNDAIDAKESYESLQKELQEADKEVAKYEAELAAYKSKPGVSKKEIDGATARLRFNRLERGKLQKELNTFNKDVVKKANAAIKANESLEKKLAKDAENLPKFKLETEIVKDERALAKRAPAETSKPVKKKGLFSPKSFRDLPQKKKAKIIQQRMKNRLKKHKALLKNPKATPLQIENSKYSILAHQRELMANELGKNVYYGDLHTTEGVNATELTMTLGDITPEFSAFISKEDLDEIGNTFYVLAKGDVLPESKDKRGVTTKEFKDALDKVNDKGDKLRAILENENSTQKQIKKATQEFVDAVDLANSLSYDRVKISAEEAKTTKKEVTKSYIDLNSIPYEFEDIITQDLLDAVDTTTYYYEQDSVDTIQKRLESNKEKLNKSEGVSSEKTKGKTQKEIAKEKSDKLKAEKAKANQKKEDELEVARQKTLTKLRNDRSIIEEEISAEQARLDSLTTKSGKAKPGKSAEVAKVKKDIKDLIASLKPIDLRIKVNQENSDNYNKVVAENTSEATVDEVTEEVAVPVDDLPKGEEKASNGILRRITSILFSNTLTDEQKVKLEDIARKLKESIVLEAAFKSTGIVSKEIFEGGDGFKGLRAYDGTIENAIKDKNQTKLDKELTGLENFKKSHESKAAAIAEAYELYRTSNDKPSKRTKYIVYRVKDSDNVWAFKEAGKIESTGLIAKLRDTGSILVEGVTFKLRDAVAEESKAITMRYEALKELSDMSISNLDSTGVPPKGGTTPTTPTAKAITEDEKNELGHFIDRDGSGINNVKVEKFKQGDISPDIDKVGDFSINYELKEKDDGELGLSLKPELIAVDKAYKARTKGNSKAPKSLQGLFMAYQVLTADANKFIGFGKVSSDSQEKRLLEGFAGRANSLTNYGEPYKATDVVVYHREAGYNDSVPMARARKAELDAAIAAGATIKVIPSRYERDGSLPGLSKDIEYIKSKGYAESAANGKATGTNGIFKKVAEDTSNGQVIPAVIETPPVDDTNVVDPIDNNDVVDPDVVEDPITPPVVVPIQQVQQAENQPNPNDQFDNILYPNEMLYESANEGLYNAVKESDYMPLEMIPVIKDVPEETGKQPVENTILKQEDTPLNLQQDFYSKYLASKDYDSVAEMLGQTELSKEQKAQLNSFVRLHNKIGKLLGKAIKKNSQEFQELKNNPLYKYILKDGANVNENLVTAITLGLFQYIQSNGRKAYATAEEVNIIHGINKNTTLSFNTSNTLSRMGIHRGFLFQEIGSGALKALGFRLNQEADTKMLQQLESSIGALAYNVVTQPTGLNTVFNPFFIEAKSAKDGLLGISHREQDTIILNGISAFEGKAYLKEQGILFQEEVQNAKTTEDLVNLINNSKDSYYDARINLTRPAISRFWNKDTKETAEFFNPEILDIIASSKKTETSGVDLLDNLFKMEKQKVAPLDAPPDKVTQAKVKKSNTAIPSNTVDALDKSSKHMWRIEATRANTVLKLYDTNPEALYRIMGIVPDAELQLLHPSERDMRMGDNAIKKELMDEQIAWVRARRDGDNYAEFYQVPVVWVNQRVGYESTLFNAQTNLFARMLSSMDRWNTTVDTSEELLNKDGSPTKHGMLLVAIAESMEGASKLMPAFGGYSPAANTVDKVQPKDFLPAFVKYLETPVVTAAIASTSKLLEGKTMTATDYANIEAAVKEFKMDELGFGALVELAAYTKAKASKDGIHHTSIGAKSDGVTNGPMFTQMLLGVADATIRMMGGVIPKAISDKVTNYLQLKSQGQIDLYERTGEAMRDSLLSYIPSDPTMSTLADTKNALALIDGDFGNRSWAKKLLTPFNYGAGLARLRAAISEGVVEKFTETYYKSYTITDAAEKAKARDSILNTLNQLVYQHNRIFSYQKITQGNLDEELNKLVYINNQEGKIKNLSPMDSTEETIMKISAYFKQNKPESKFPHDKDDVAKVEYWNKYFLRKRDKNDNPVIIPGVSLDGSNGSTAIDFEKDIPIKYTNMIRNLSDISFGVASEEAIKTTEAVYMKKRDELTLLSNSAYNNYASLRSMYIENLGFDKDNLTVAQKEAVDKDLFNYRAAVASGMSNLNIINGNRYQPVASGINLEDQVKKTHLGLNIAFNKLFRSNNDKSPTVQYDYGYTFNDVGNPGVRALALMIQSMDATVTVQAMAEFEGMNFHDANMFGLEDFTKGVQLQNEKFFEAIIKYDPSREFVKAYTRPFFKMHEMYNDKTTSKDIRNEIFKRMNAQAKDTDFPALAENAYRNEIEKLELALSDGIIHQYSGVGGEFTVTPEMRTLIKERLKEVKKARKQELKKFNDMLSNYLGEEAATTDVDALYDTLAIADRNTKNQFLRDMIAKGDVNINQFTSYVAKMMETMGATIADKSLVGYLTELQDTDLSKVKIKYVQKPLPARRGEEIGEKDIRFSKINNTIYINQNSTTVDTKDILKEVLVASLHHNMMAIKNGSEQFKDLTEQYRTLKIMANSLNSIIDKALVDTQITSDEATMLKDLFGDSDNKGNVEFLMTTVLYGSEGVKAALGKIKDFEVSNESVLNRIKKFISNILKGNKKKDAVLQDDSLLSFLTGTTSNILEGSKGYDGLVQKRSSSTISKMLADSYKSHTNAFTRESTDQRANVYDTRFQHELYKLGFNNKGKPIDAEKVLDLMEGTLNALDEQDKSKSELTTLQADYETTLRPVITTLRQYLSKGSKVVIVNDFNDILAMGISQKQIEESNLLNGISLGAAFAHDKTVYLISPMASSNPNTRMSIVLHEMLHVMTTYELNKPNNKHKQNFAKLVAALKAEATKQGITDREILYALSKPEELISQVKTRNVVRQFLMNNEVLRADYFKYLTATLGDGKSETVNAMEIFDSIFANLEKSIQAEVVPLDTTVLAEPFTERTIKLKTGLNAIGIVDAKGMIAQDFLEFNDKAVQLTVEKYPVIHENIMKFVTPVDAKVMEDYMKGEETFQLVEAELDSPVTKKEPSPKTKAVKRQSKKLADANKQATENTQLDLFGEIATQATIKKSNEILFSNSQAGGHVGPEQRFSPRTIYDYLKSDSTQDNAYLDDIVDEVVNPLMDNISSELIQGYDYEKVWHDAIVQGSDVYASKAHDAGFVLDAQQGYVLEVLEVSLANSIDDVTNTAVYRQLEKAYKQAKANVKIEDFHDGEWLNATPDEVLLAETKFNFIFRPGNTGGKSDYLTNFAAMTLVSKELQDILSFSVDRVTTDKPMNERVTDMFGKVVEYFEGQSANIYGTDNINNKVQDLSKQLAKVYYKNQDIAQQNDRGAFGKVDDVVSNLSQKVLDGLKSAAISVSHVPGLRETSGAKIVNKLLTEQYEDFDKFVNHMADNFRVNKPLGEVGEVFNELVGTLDNAEHAQAKDIFYGGKMIEQERGGIIEDIGKAIIEAFAKDNQKLSPKVQKAVTNVLLRTDLQSLLKTMAFKDVMNLVKDSTALNAEIVKEELELAKVFHGKEYLARTKSLANYMVYRRATDNMLAKNAYAIVERVGLGGVERDINYTPETLARVDRLASLYALRMSDNKAKTRVTELFDSEVANNKSKNTGLEYAMLSHKDFAEESVGLFEENPYSIAKGFLPNITNPIKGFAIVDESEVATYRSMGYVEATGIRSSELQGVRGNKVLMTVSNNGMQRYVSGALSIEDTVKAGTNIVKKGDHDLDRMVSEAKAELVKAQGPNYRADPNAAFLIPSYGKDGSIISFSYEMNNVGLDTHLERNNNFGTLLSQMKGANLNKKAYPSHNKKVADYLVDSFNQASTIDKRKYVEVGPNATTKKGRELWHSMPKEMQLYIIEKQGVSSINVRNDEMNLLFGYRKVSLGSIFDKTTFERNMAEQLYAVMFQALFGSKAQLRSNQINAMWMELIKTLKDFIVIRNLKVLIVNVLSNVSLTMVNDADPKNMIKDIKDAATYSIKYQKDKQRLNTVKHQLKIGLGSPEMVSEFAELKDAIARNPLADFIEAGMMPLIVNDISFKKDEVEFSTGFSTLKDNTVGKLPKFMQTGLDYALVAPGTPHYKFLANATQQSDFVFKYALYKQEMRKGNTSEAALKLARQVFIEYDVPTSKGMTFINDNGIFMFTKFTLRIMRVLVHFIKTRANKLLIENAAMSMLFNNPSLLSLNFISQMWGGRNPLNMPLDDVLTMYDNAFPVQMIKAAIK